MTGDDHGNGGTADRFLQFAALNPGCSVEDWECVRATSYIYTNTPLSNSEAAVFNDMGFEIALHVNTNCANWTSTFNLQSFYNNQLQAFGAKYTDIPAPSTNRTHCIAWSDWSSQPGVELLNQIRLDTNYYYWPPTWVLNRPGMFTGMGIPMRFADLSGSMIDVFLATTQMTDESGQTYPYTIDALLDKALGPEGFYGVFTANMHTDSNPSPGADAIVASASERNVPVVSALQMLQWLDGRNNSFFTINSFTNNILDFNITKNEGARGLQGMLPINFQSKRLLSLTHGENSVLYSKETIKGIEYAFFAVEDGNYEADYGSTPPIPPDPPVPPEPDHDWRSSVIVGAVPVLGSGFIAGPALDVPPPPPIAAPPPVPAGPAVAVAVETKPAAQPVPSGPIPKVKENPPAKKKFGCQQSDAPSCALVLLPALLLLRRMQSKRRSRVRYEE